MGGDVSDATITLVVLAVIVVLFVWNRLPVEVVALGSALALYFTGVIGLADAGAGFGDPTVVLIAALFVVSEGLDSTGVTTWVGQSLLAGAGDRRRKLLALIMLLSAALTALINLNGSVAALLPMVVVIAIRLGIPPSQVLMPLAFAGSAGSLLLLTGSPVNVIISESAADAGGGAFSFAEFAIVGVPLVVGTVLLVVLLGNRLLPDRVSRTAPPDLSRHAATLAAEYSLDGLVHLRVQANSSLLGAPRDSWDLTDYPGINVVTVMEAASGRPVFQGLLADGDRLTVVGDEESVARFAADQLLTVEAVYSRAEVANLLIRRDGGAAEVLIPPRSQLLGETVRPGQLIRGGSLVILAVKRQGKEPDATETVLQAGDVLLVEGPWAALDESVEDSDLLVVDAPHLVRRQAVPLGQRSTQAVVVLVSMVALLATGLVPAVVAAVLAAGAMIVLRVLSVQQAYRRISWTTVLLVGGMIPLSIAIQKSGAGEQVAELIVDGVGDAGPVMLLVALFCLTVVFGQLISNTATALVVIPIAVSAAQQLDVSAQPVLMCVCVAAAASFLTPVATPANMMIMAPAGYRFGDYWKLGLPMIGLFFVVAVGMVPLVWNF